MILGNQKELYINSFLQNRVADIQKYFNTDTTLAQENLWGDYHVEGACDQPYTTIQFKFLLQ